MAESNRDELRGDLFDRFVDDLLSPEETAAFEAELSRDPDLAFELDNYGEMVSLLRSTPPEAPPDRFVWMVQQRIRRRSRGRWFGSPTMRTFVLEAAVCMVLMLATVAMYIIAMPTPTPPELDGASRVSLHAADRHALEQYGELATVGMSILGEGLEVSLRVQEEHLPALRDALRGHPRLSLREGSEVHFEGAVMLRIDAQTGVVNTGF